MADFLATEGQRLYDEALTTNSGIDFSGLSNPITFAQGEAFLEQIFALNKFDKDHPLQEGTSRPSISIRSYISYVQNIVDTLESSGKLITFPLTQIALHALNPVFGQGKIASPSIIIGPPPFAGGITTDSLDVPVSSMDPVSNRLLPNYDKLKKLYDGQYVEIVTEAGIPPVRIDGPGLRFSNDDGSGLSQPLNVVNSVVGAPLTGKTLAQKAQEQNIASKEEDFRNLVIADPYENINIELEKIDGVNFQHPDYAKIFDRKNTGPGFSTAGLGATYYAPTSAARTRSNNAALVGAQRNKDVFFNAEDLENGFMTSLVNETQAVVPFYFEDLRKPGRFLYFRAFLDSFSETLAPDWNAEKFYGRVDPVPTYMNTQRTFSVSFKIVAMSKAGLTTMWRKINNLCKMVYPTFTNGILSAGPVIRLRIGDVLASDNSGQGVGLPGYLEGLNFEYTGAPWEIESFQSSVQEELGKVPQWAVVTFNFQVIHENNPELDSDYNFNSKNFRRMGTLTADIANLSGDQRTENQNANTATGDFADDGTTDQTRIT